MTNKFTNQAFWRKYWSSKKNIKKITANLAFSDIFDRELSKKSGQSMIEIGGFPGICAMYFKKYWGFQSTLLDYVFNKKETGKLLEVNNLKPEDITIINNDFLKYKSKIKYDLVFSLGFIEHFNDISDVISRHWSLTKRGGKMIIGIPNFYGINGVYQKLFDLKNLEIHNLKAMDTVILKKIMKKLKITKYKIFYKSGALVWLENIKSRNTLLQIFTYMLNIIGLGLTRLGIKGKIISTHIFIIAQK